MSVQIGIPWRPAPDREDAFIDTCHWYESHDFEVVYGESPKRSVAERPFNLAKARNHLVRNVMTADVMVLSDADTIPEYFPLMEAIAAASADDLVHLPYHLYLDGDGQYIPGATSGVYVFTRRAWESTNGQDERFEGWGYEDSAWRLAHLTLNGRIPRHEGLVQASSHAPASRARLSLNRNRYREYQEAYGHVDRMQHLVGRSYWLNPIQPHEQPGLINGPSRPHRR
jgi:hypothetical protein